MDASERADCARGSWLAAAAGLTAAMATLIGLTLWSTHHGGTTGGVFALDIAVAVISLGLAPLALRWPVAAGLALGVLATLSPTATPAATVAVLLVARSRRFPVALGVGVVGLAGHAIQGLWRPVGGISYGWWLLLIAAAYAALIGWGELAQARDDLLISLRERAHRAETEQGRRVAEARLAERARIAREMHDVLAHRLSLLATYAGALEFRPDSSPAQIASAAGVVRSGVHQALDELRQVITLLRDDSEPSGRPQPVLTDIPCLVDESRDAGAPIELDNRIAEPGDVPAATGRTAYRVVQEALTNARKHATGQSVTVVIDGVPGGRLDIDVRNATSVHQDGASVLGTGMGLIGLTERVQLAGGQLDHQVTASGEFRLHAWLPWPV
jgi:signal transduction histidine kinase